VLFLLPWVAPHIPSILSIRWMLNSDWGMINTKEPRAMGGNLDNKELTEGTTLYLPVFNEGALFSAGDGHGVQGDGEVCINALEICLTGHFRLSLVKGGGAKDPVLKFPRAETKTHYITMGLNEDLDLAMKQALREMKLLVHPSAVVPVRIGGNVGPDRGAQSVLAFIFLYFQTIAILTFAMLLTGMDFVTALSSIVASVNNMGPALGPTGAAGTYKVITDGQTWICSVAMLLGRLEIFSVLVLFTPAFWRK